MRYYELRKQIADTFRFMIKHNLSSYYGGNISIRTPDNPSNFLITPSGKKKDTLQPEDIVIIDKNGNVLEGAYKPSIEHNMHIEIYEHRKDVNAIIHAHTIFSSAFAVARVDIPKLIEEYVIAIGGEVKVAKFAPAGSKELAENIVEGLGFRKAVLVANHGVVTCGKNLEDALNVLVSVEKTAQLFVYAKLLGEPHQLPEEVAEKMISIYKKRNNLTD